MLVGALVDFQNIVANGSNYSFIYRLAIDDELRLVIRKDHSVIQTYLHIEREFETAFS